MRNKPTGWFCALIIGCCLCQAVDAGDGIDPNALHVIIPQSRFYGLNAISTITVRATDVQAHIAVQPNSATVMLTIGLENLSHQMQTLQLLVPVPIDSTLKSVDDPNSAGWLETRLLRGDEAWQNIMDLVARTNNPGPVEFLGYNLIQSGTITLAPRDSRQVHVTYEQPAQIQDQRVDIFMPRSEFLTYQVPWDIRAVFDLGKPLSTAYSPSHEIALSREANHRLVVKNTATSRLIPGPFRLSVLLEAGKLSGSVFAYPAETWDGGYFLLWAGLPEEPTPPADAIKRELTLVLDRSGSMRGRKVEQVKQAAVQVIASLQANEAFNLFAYNSIVDHFSAEPLYKTPSLQTEAERFLATITGTGSTDIHEALRQALQQPPTEGMLPLILFLTDGLPTSGNTSEIAIRNLVVEANPYQRRVYTFGVGYDLNAPLLNALSDLSRGKSTFILPEQDVDSVMTEVFENLSGPVIADLQLQILTPEGTPTEKRVIEILPWIFPDIFQEDHLLLLGRYLGQEALVFEIQGNYLNQQRSFQLRFDPNTAQTKHSFVPTLWASRIIGEMLAYVLELAAEPDFGLDDPRFMPLVLDMVGLSIEFGVVTEYTSFLAEHDVDLADYANLLFQTMFDLHERSSVRSGRGAVNQSINVNALRNQRTLNPYNRYLDPYMHPRQSMNVQHVHDLTFYFHQDTWIDSRLVSPGSELPDDAPVHDSVFGSDAYKTLARDLTQVGRQGALGLGGTILILDRDAIAVVQTPTVVIGPPPQSDTSSSVEHGDEPPPGMSGRGR